MSQNSRFTVPIFVAITGLMLLFSLSTMAQTEVDSMVKNYMVKNNQIRESDVIFKKVTKTGKHTATVESNIFNKQVFCMANDDEVLKIYGFGTYSDHGNRCLLFDYTISGNHNYSYVGLGRIDEELTLLSSIFTAGKHKIPDQYQQEILEIYLGYRQGKIEVPIFLHCQK